MDIAEVLTLADELIFAKTGKHLDYVQEAILRGTLQDTTYTQIAQEVYSSPSHVRNVGSQLWKILSKALKKNITKNNFRAVLEKASFYNYQLAIVENVTGENITVNHNVNICHEKARSPTSPQNPQPTAKQPRIDLGDAPEISTFFNRTSELTTLENWILRPHPPHHHLRLIRYWQNRPYTPTNPTNSTRIRLHHLAKSPQLSTPRITPNRLN